MKQSRCVIRVGVSANRVGVLAPDPGAALRAAGGTTFAPRCGSMWRVLVHSTCFLGLLLGCGGHTVGGPDETEQQPSPAAPAPSGADRPSRGPVTEGDTELGECVLGVKVTNAPSGICPWLADGRCYEEREMACNCVCPRTHDSQCLSGFEGGPKGRVEVTCK